MLLNAAGVDFTIQKADLDEAGLTENLLAEGRNAGAIALGLAGHKATVISRQNPQAIVLGGDSILALGRELIDKSPDLSSLRAQLRKLSGRTHTLISAAALARGGAVFWHHTGQARMTMRTLSDAFIEDYLAREGEALLGSVGGYHFEGLGAQLFEDAEGDYFSILGLPLLPVLKELRAQGLLGT